MNPNKIFLKENNTATIRFQVLGVDTPALRVKMGLRLASVCKEHPVPLMLHSHREIQAAWDSNNGQVIVSQIGTVTSMKFAVSILELNTRYVDAEVSLNPDRIEMLKSTMMENPDDGTLKDDVAIFPRMQITPFGVNEVMMSDILGLDLVYQITHLVRTETVRDAQERHLDFINRKTTP